MNKFKNILRSLVYPGLDLRLYARCALTRFWRKGPRRVLDAGSGNGYFSLLAYRSGASVLGLNFEQGQVDKAREFLIGHKKFDPQRLEFRQFNLYDLPSLEGSFDEIICFETLEHIKGDDVVCREFFRLLTPGGSLHLCCPYALHPRHQQEVLDEAEQGGHVRHGYTEESYRTLLEPLGFRIARVHGVESTATFTADKWLRKLRHAAGDLAALPLFPLAKLTVPLSNQIDPPVPFSIYVEAVKPESR